MTIELTDSITKEKLAIPKGLIAGYEHKEKDKTEIYWETLDKKIHSRLVVETPAQITELIRK